MLRALTLRCHVGFHEFAAEIRSFEKDVTLRRNGRIAPLSAYPLTDNVPVGSIRSIQHVSQPLTLPTKVVFRSCKLIPTMVIASFSHKRYSPSWSTLSAPSDMYRFNSIRSCRLGTPTFIQPHWSGLVSMSVVADSILPNAERTLSFGIITIRSHSLHQYLYLIAMTHYAAIR
jgi:hypothetical protein